MFISYLFTNIKNVFWTWIILTLLNQIIFFGACLAPYCILASIPHVSLITFVIMYVSYTTARDTYNRDGFNKFGYDKDGYSVDGYGRDGYDCNGYSKYGYGRDGYDCNGYDINGYGRDGKDRLGKGFFGRLFAGSEHHEKIAKMNKEAINKNADRKAEKKRDRLAKQHLKELDELDAMVDAKLAAIKAAEIDPKAKAK